MNRIDRDANAPVSRARCSRKRSSSMAAGAHEVIAYTQPEWAAAMAFYVEHGFEPYGRVDIDVHLKRRI